jgi:hypothetical protein
MLVLVIDIANQMISDPCIRNKVAFHSHVTAAAFDVSPSCSCTPSFMAQQWRAGKDAEDKDEIVVIAQHSVVISMFCATSIGCSLCLDSWKIK